MSQSWRSIGEVLSLLAEEHPDLTISKIRFLESQGLISPPRSPSGYRQFFDADVERLNWILIQQRDHFLPLKEIGHRIASGAAARAAPRAVKKAAAAAPSLFSSSPRGDAGDDEAGGDEADAADGGGEGASSEGSGGLTAAELAQAVGIDAEHIAELQRLGFIAPAAAGPDGDDAVFDHDAVLIAQAVAALAEHGMPARNLRMFKVAADREAGVYEQVLGSLIARGDTVRLRSELDRIVELTESLRRLLLRRTLRPHLD